jgi:hypothetical protein
MFAESWKHAVVLSVVALALGATAVAQATPLYDYQSSTTDPMAYAGLVSNSDLINGSAPSTFTGWQPNFGNSANLTNGSYGGNHAIGDICWADTDPVAIYDFATAKDISEIRTFASWDDPNLLAQIYSVYVKHSGNSDFDASPIASANFNPGGSSQATMVTITDSTGTLASNVVGIRFAFTASAGGPQPAFREFDITGTTSIPEPSTAILLSAGLLSLLAYAWRKRK